MKITSIVNVMNGPIINNEMSNFLTSFCYTEWPLTSYFGSRFVPSNLYL